MKIIIADDHEIFRDGLRSLLEKEADMALVGEADNGRTTVQLVHELSPDVVIMDVGMPDLNGIEASRQIKKQSPNVKILALSMHSANHFVVGMLQAGASGYVLKDCAFEELITAIRMVAANQIYLSPRVADEVVKDYVGHLFTGAPLGRPLLTPREREVLQLLTEGKSTKEAAHLLNISVKTIETHRLQIMEKLNIHSMAELTKYAIREGLTSLEP